MKKNNQIWTKLGVIIPLSITLIFSVLAYVKSTATKEADFKSEIKDIKEDVSELKEDKKDGEKIIGRILDDISVLKTGVSNNSISIKYINDGNEKLNDRLDLYEYILSDEKRRSAKSKK